MQSDDWRGINRNLTKEQRAFPVFRFRRGLRREPDRNVNPFTVMPKELKQGRFAFGRLVRGFFNFLLLLILGLALLALDLAFYYQMIHQPEVLAGWANGLLAALEGVYQSLVALIP